MRLREGALGPINGVDVTDLLDEKPPNNVRKFVHLLPITPSANSEEISQIEMKPEELLRGMIIGARSVLTALGGLSGISTPEEIEFHLKKIFSVDQDPEKAKKFASSSNSKLKPMKLLKNILVRPLKKILNFS